MIEADKPAAVILIGPATDPAPGIARGSGTAVPAAATARQSIDASLIFPVTASASIVRSRGADESTPCVVNVIWTWRRHSVWMVRPASFEAVIRSLIASPGPLVVVRLTLPRYRIPSKVMADAVIT